MRELALDDIEALAVGAWILGTGGGGSPYLGLLNMRWLYADGHRVELMSPLDLADEDWVAVVSNMGAPLIGQERLGDLRPYPCVLYDPRGIEAVVTKVPSWKWMERVSRKICVEMGSIASTCKAPRTGAEVKEWGIHFTTTKAIGIGHRVREARRRHKDPVAAILDEGHGKLLFRGKVGDVARRTTEGFLRGTATVEGLDDDRGSRLKLAFQNEWVVAWRDGAPIAMSPDLICVLDTVSGNAFGTETIRYGMRVTVVALPAPAVFLSPKGLQHVGPRAFGYDIEFNSVFA